MCWIGDWWLDQNVPLAPTKKVSTAKNIELEERYLGAIYEAEAEAYRDTGFVHSGDDEYYVHGKVFSSAKDAESYIERQKYLESLYVSARSENVDLNAALIDPASTFGSIENLMATPLSPTLKLQLLKRWAYDAKLLEMAEGEGMIAPSNGDLLQDIALAIADLGTAT